MARHERLLVCPKCGVEQKVLLPSARAWHTSCKKISKNQSPPEMKEVK